MHGAAHWHARRVRQVPAESAVRGKPVATRLNKSRAWRTAIYALEKLMQGVDALATGAGRAQERLGHGYLQPVTCSRLTTQRGAGGVRTV